MKEVLGTGEFWLPENPDSTVFGTLRARDGEAEGVLELRTDGALLAQDQLEASGSIDYWDSSASTPFIYGVIDGQLVTLLNSRHFHLRIHMQFKRQFQPMGFKEGYLPQWILWGAHIDSTSDKHAMAVSIQMTGLLSFLGSRGMERSWSQNADSGELLEAVYRYRYPEQKVWHLENFDLYLRGAFASKGDWENLTLTEYGYFQVKSQTALPLSRWISEVIEPVRQMCAFVSNGDSVLETIKILPPNGRVTVSGGERDDFSILLKMNDPNAYKRDRKSKRVMEWLFLASEIDSERMELLLNQKDEYSGFYQHVGALEEQRLTWEQLFQQLVAVIEGMHRRLNPVTEDELRSYEEIKTRIIEEISSLSRKDIDLVEKGLKYGYEPSLEQRLRSLTNELRTEILTSKTERKRFNIFLQEMATHRNYLVHRLPSDTPPLGREQLISACRLLQLLTRFLVFRQVGFDVNQTWELLKDTMYVRDWRHRWKSMTSEED